MVPLNLENDFLLPILTIAELELVTARGVDPPFEWVVPNGAK